MPGVKDRSYTETISLFIQQLFIIKRQVMIKRVNLALRETELACDPKRTKTLLFRKKNRKWLNNKSILIFSYTTTMQLRRLYKINNLRSKFSTGKKHNKNTFSLILCLLHQS